MTAGQWLRHLWVWLLTFPIKNKTGHLWLGMPKDPKRWCLICKANHKEQS